MSAITVDPDVLKCTLKIAANTLAMTVSGC
jgi:hypothetical protein